MRTTASIVVWLVIGCGARPDTLPDAAPEPGNVTLTITRSGTGSGDITSSPVGIACGSSCSVTMLENTEVTLVATPATNAVFTGWSGSGCAGTGVCSVTLSGGPMIVDAGFEMVPTSLTVVKAGNGSGVVSSDPVGIDCGADCTELYDPGAVVTLRATPAVGSTFTGWSAGACAGTTGSCTMVVSGATTATATFTSSKELTSFAFLTANNPGLAFDVTATITGTSIKATVPLGTILTGLKATFSTTGTSVLVNGTAQTTGVTAHDFTNSIIYRVVAVDASTNDYTVTVTIARPLVFARTDLPTGAQPMFLAITDLNGDGKPDLGFTTAGTPAVTPPSVSVVLNTTATNATTPSFAAGVTYLAGANPGSIAFADINGDRRPDLVATTSPSNFSVLLNTTLTNATTPSFAAAADFGAGGGAFVAIGDLNRDGRPDVTVVGGSTISVFLNTTATNAAMPTFATKVDFPAGLVPFSVAIGDLNGDGAPDLAVANESADTVSILLSTTAANATTPSFSPKVDFVTGPGTFPAPYSVAIGDFDGDGRPDVAVANAFQTVSTVSIFLNTTATAATTPSFAAKLDLPTGSSPVCLALGDLDNDGKPDLAIANNSSGNVSVLRDLTPPNAAAPLFAPRQNFVTGSSPRYVAIGDFNGDGMPDLAVTNQGSSTVSLMLAQ